MSETAFNVNVPAVVRTSELHVGDITARHDCTVTVCGILAYSTCNGHYATERQAIAAGKKAARDFARRARARHPA